MGIELAARAGYDPHAAVTLWQKMMMHSGGQDGVAFTSTHPAHSARIAELMALEPKARPLYEAARVGAR